MMADDIFPCEDCFRFPDTGFFITFKKQAAFEEP